MMERLLKQSRQFQIDKWVPKLSEAMAERRAVLELPKGKAFVYRQLLEKMPEIPATKIDFDQDAVTAIASSDIPSDQLSQLEKALISFGPWRKGPFNLFGIYIDSEWQSFIKWNRVKEKISSLKDRRILDIGSSNGYYMFRMASDQPFMVLGLEPQETFYYQYLALQRYLRAHRLFCFPGTFEAFPVMESYFDTVFCMGILSHRKSPLDMLGKIYAMMSPDGELVIENLVIESNKDICLFPADRYAKMRNIYFIPSISTMGHWLGRCGFKNVRCLDISRTTSVEQRKTKWIQTESLSDFIDPADVSRTLEGYPAPVRGIFIARRS